ncbi:hexitol phosphatase HxpB [Echinimonas agarilytica]|uniref:Hexitol phosphatase HxpB n=1 Tax=Echinimonas agarilytica TaxID=1215918 RepID=A0AA41W6J9_9GAMM|nr:hexitol phosphatase HxpB [Echinimonas agarilytica]MCM2679484.1 hexitol phosphatase HxpB [Echinimonas agarilytica]
MKAIIFDMDGVLIDSEPFWQQAEVDVFNRHGVPVTFEMAESTMGLRIDLVVEHWFKHYPCDASVAQLSREILDAVGELVAEQGQAMPGLFECLKRIQQLNVPIGLATSSPLPLAHTVIQRLGLESVFNAVLSAEKMQYGKPHPQVYQDCAEALGVSPLDCLAIEDSITGLISAKAARMKALAVPPEIFFNKSGYGIADLKLSRLDELTNTHLTELGFSV